MKIVKSSHANCNGYNAVETDKKRRDRVVIKLLHPDLSGLSSEA